MIWLQRPPWAKWMAVGLLVGIAFWLEVRPDPRVEHPFALVHIPAGDPIGEHNTEMRAVPRGLFDPPAEDSHALTDIPAGTPILATDAGAPGSVIPGEWWIVSVELPTGATVGDRVRVVLLDDGRAINGVVSAVGASDAFTTRVGGIAVAPSHAAEVAMAAATGRIAVLVSAG